jgi:hypothetical protein
MQQQQRQQEQEQQQQSQITVTFEQCRAICEWLGYNGMFHLAIPFQQRFCPNYHEYLAQARRKSEPQTGSPKLDFVQYRRISSPNTESISQDLRLPTSSTSPNSPPFLSASFTPSASMSAVPLSSGQNTSTTTLHVGRPNTVSSPPLSSLTSSQIQLQSQPQLRLPPSSSESQSQSQSASVPIFITPSEPPTLATFSLSPSSPGSCNVAPQNSLAGSNELHVTSSPEFLSSGDLDMAKSDPDDWNVENDDATIEPLHGGPIQSKIEIKQMNNRFWEPLDGTLSKGQPAKLTVYGIPLPPPNEPEIRLLVSRYSQLQNRLGQSDLKERSRASLETKSWKFRRVIQDTPFKIVVESTDPDLLVSQAPRYKGVRSALSSDGCPTLTVEFGVKLEGNTEHNSDAFVVSVQQKHGPKRIFSQSFDIDTYRKSQRPAKKAKKSPQSDTLSEQKVEEALRKAASDNLKGSQTPLDSSTISVAIKNESVAFEKPIATMQPPPLSSPSHLSSGPFNDNRVTDDALTHSPSNPQNSLTAITSIPPATLKNTSSFLFDSADPNKPSHFQIAPKLEPTTNYSNTSNFLTAITTNNNNTPSNASNNAFTSFIVDENSNSNSTIVNISDFLISENSLECQNNNANKT